MNSSRHAVVIGAGISGLACALRLRELGVSVSVLEAAANPGGVISSVRENGFLFECGPQSFQLTADLRELIRSAGMEPEILQANPRAPRFVLRAGKLHRAPMSPRSFLTTSLLSIGSKIRVFTEPFRRSRRPASDDESFAHFVRRKFGPEFLEYLAGPFVSGIFAGDPEKLSVRSAFPAVAQWEAEYGSVIRGAMKSRGSGSRQRPTLASFKNGIGSLMTGIAATLGPALRMNSAAKSIAPADAGEWTICENDLLADVARQNKLSARALVLAVPACEAAKLTAPLNSARLSSALNAIPYAPVIVVSQAYRREDVGHTLEGFGFLVPRNSGLRTLGVIWNSSLFPGRCPADVVLITAFLGGATDPEIFALDEAQIAAQVRQETIGLLRITGAPLSRHVWRHTRALPQYHLGHAQRVAAIRSELSHFPGIFIAGNYLDGPSIGSCVTNAFDTAKAVAEYFGGNAGVASAT